jgi:bifunctional non-homologous end joining protein LigD
MPRKKRPARQPSTLAFTNTEKVMFPKPRLTKGDVLDFYRGISKWLLPYLKDRPITVQRFPDGVKPGAVAFWQKNTPEHYPSWIKRVTLPTERGKDVTYSLINDLRSLLYFVNQGVITFHVYFSRVQSLERPDFVLFDLDPGVAPFRNVVTIAKAIHSILDAQKLKNFVKTSGKSGLHILAPWNKGGGYDEARAWAMEMAENVSEKLSEIATVERSKSARKGRVYVDVMQNVLGHHAVPPYVLRATPDATVSMPLEWNEVNHRLDPTRFTLKNALARLKKNGDLLRPIL